MIGADELIHNHYASATHKLHQHFLICDYVRSCMCMLYGALCKCACVCARVFCMCVYVQVVFVYLAYGLDGNSSQSMSEEQ